MGAIVGRARSAQRPAIVNQPAPPFNVLRPRLDGPPNKVGTYAAIDRVEGDRIHLRDPRSGRTWSVRANKNTVVQVGPRKRIPYDDLRPGQRVFVVGVPDTPNANQAQEDTDWDAQFIGVMLAQPQRFMRPPPLPCVDCDELNIRSGQRVVEDWKLR